MTSMDLLYLFSGSLFLIALIRVPQGQILQSILACACTGFAIFGALHGYVPVALLNTAMVLFLLYKRAYAPEAPKA
ncbi:MAG: hypothetical protein AAFY59_02300 [Pseudomonadota bacterium]